MQELGAENKGYILMLLFQIATVWTFQLSVLTIKLNTGAAVRFWETKEMQILLNPQLCFCETCSLYLESLDHPAVRIPFSKTEWSGQLQLLANAEV